ncbi:integrase, partial [Paraburkholderia aspalathi]|nr:integrase [Paraburkholderia aspalathi]
MARRTSNVSEARTMAFTQEYVRLTRDRKKTEAKPQSLGWLVSEYTESADFQKLKPTTKHDYERMVGVILAKFGTLPIPALEARGARRLFLEWRDTMRSAPRSADLHVTVLARILSWGKNREVILRNPLEKIGKIHKSNRKDIIWMPHQIKKFMDEGAPHLSDVIRMALWTMQCQSDIVYMPTIAFS